MADTISHRGPDDEGYFTSGPIGLGFRRLSIIDLKTGHQPISNEDGSVWIVFNGEIYNFQELRDFLVTKGHAFRTKTDTEVIVHLYEELGESCVEKLRGMFGFAIWDDRKKSLFIARDRVGIKPLYYHLSENSIVFASEIKAILADPQVIAEVSPEMIDRFLTFYYMPGEHTLFRNIRKLEPACYMTIKAGKVQVKQYWDLHFAPVKKNIRDAEQELCEMLEETMHLHMISDVPVGFLLSGGVDSTAMLGLAADKTDKTLSTFTVGFSAAGLADERPFATIAARRYGSDHHEMTISAKQFADFLPQYAWYMEEPICEPPAVALYYISRLAKDFVKVLISGEGGDEAFGGYPNYRNLLWLERFKKTLGPFGGLLSSVMRASNRVLHSRQVGKYAPLMDASFDSYYYSRSSSPFTFFNLEKDHLYSEDFRATVDPEVSTKSMKEKIRRSSGYGIVNRMLYVDTTTSLPDDLLLKADKMTMANSIELRVPLLDHRLLEFAASLPERFKVHGFSTKYIAKKALQSKVPNEILDRKKAGFPVPYESWMRVELKNWVADILLDSTTLSRGYFKRSAVERLIKADLDTKRYPKEIFSLVSLELWHRAFIDNHAESTVSTLFSPVAAQES